MFNSKQPLQQPEMQNLTSSELHTACQFLQQENPQNLNLPVVLLRQEDEAGANSEKRKVEATNLVGQAQADYAKKHGEEAEAEFQKKVEYCPREVLANFLWDMLTLGYKLKEEFAKQRPEIIDPPPAAFINHPVPASNFKPSSSTAEGGVKPFLVPHLNETFMEDEAGANSEKRKVEATNLVGQAQADYAKKHGEEAEAEFQKKMEYCPREVLANFLWNMLTLGGKLNEEFAKQRPEIIDPPPVAFINHPVPALNFKPSSSTAEGGVKPFFVPDLNETFMEDEAGANCKKRKVEATNLVGQAPADYAKKHGEEAEAEFEKKVEYCPREVLANFLWDMLILGDKLKKEFAKMPLCKRPEIIDPPPAAFINHPVSASNFEPSSSTAEGGVKPFLVPDLNETFVEDEAGESTFAFAIGEEGKANSKKRKVEAISGVGQDHVPIMPTFSSNP